MWLHKIEVGLVRKFGSCDLPCKISDLFFDLDDPVVHASSAISQVMMLACKHLQIN